MSKQTGQAVTRDSFVRFFHWTLVLCFTLAWVTAEDSWKLHEQAGYYVLVLVGLRVIWGLVGSRYARFKSFLYSPKQVISYFNSMLTGHSNSYMGHNPAGGWMILMLLLCLTMTGATGILLTESPDSVWEEIHEGSANLMLFLVSIHIIAIFVTSFLHGENLIKQMLTGKKTERNHDV